MNNITLKKKTLLAASLSFIAASFPIFAQPISAASIDAAVAKNATNEWDYFGKQTMKNGNLVKAGKKEGDEPYWRRVAHYWKSSPIGRSDIDTPSEVMSDNNPWSAAFVSYIMAGSGAGKQFKYSAAHHDYIRDAIDNRKDGKTTAPFVGYRLSEYSPMAGDLVCASRGADLNKVTYDNAPTYTTWVLLIPKRRFLAHCDIVVATRAGEVDVIGGNVENSVTKNTITLVRNPSLKAVIPSTEGRFVLIRNNASAK